MIQAVRGKRSFLPGLFQCRDAAVVAVQLDLEGTVTAERGKDVILRSDFVLQLPVHVLQPADELFLIGIGHGSAVDGTHGIQAGFPGFRRGCIIFGRDGDIPSAGVDGLLPEGGVLPGRTERVRDRPEEGKEIFKVSFRTWFAEEPVVAEGVH